MALIRLRFRSKLRLAVVATAALLIAQFGAMSHVYSHDAVRAAASHSTGVTLPGASSHDPCNDCLAFAPLLSAAGTPGTLPVVEPEARGVPTRATAGSLIEDSLTLAFRSRAPPHAF